MTSATYPNHATFVTGVPPRDARHRHQLGAADRSVVPAWELGPAVPTLFDACRAAGRSSAAVFGDQCLVGVMGARAADTALAARRRTAGRRSDATRTATSTTATRSWSSRARRPADPTWSSASSTRPTPPRTCTDPTARPRWQCYRDTDALLAAGPRPPRLGRHRVDHRVRPRPGDRSTTGRPSTSAPEFARRGLDLFALPRAAPPSICGAGAATRAPGSPTSTASRARHRSTSPTPTSSAAWRGRRRGAPSASRRWAPSSAPTAVRGRAPRSRW